MIYAGIGSRETPLSILAAFEAIARNLASQGHVLRSGRAPGADSYFEKGAIAGGGRCEIFVPWYGFPKGSALATRPAIIFDRLEPAQKQRALDSVNHYHPAPDRLSQGALKLMARNYCQMFGQSVNSHPTDLVICWTRDGGATGGTGQAIRMATDANIPVLNAHGYEEIPDEFVCMVCNFVAEHFS